MTIREILNLHIYNPHIFAIHLVLIIRKKFNSIQRGPLNEEMCCQVIINSIYKNKILVTDRLNHNPLDK